MISCSHKHSFVPIEVAARSSRRCEARNVARRLPINPFLHVHACCKCTGSPASCLASLGRWPRDAAPRWWKKFFPFIVISSPKGRDSRNSATTRHRLEQRRFMRKNSRTHRRLAPERPVDAPRDCSLLFYCFRPSIYFCAKTVQRGASSELAQNSRSLEKPLFLGAHLRRATYSRLG